MQGHVCRCKAEASSGQGHRGRQTGRDAGGAREERRKCVTVTCRVVGFSIDRAAASWCEARGSGIRSLRDTPGPQPQNNRLDRSLTASEYSCARRIAAAISAHNTQMNTDVHPSLYGDALLIVVEWVTSGVSPGCGVPCAGSRSNP